MKRNQLRNRIVSVKMTQELYDELSEITSHIGLPISTYIYLVIRQHINNELNH